MSFFLFCILQLLSPSPCLSSPCSQLTRTPILSIFVFRQFSKKIIFFAQSLVNFVSYLTVFNPVICTKLSHAHTCFNLASCVHKMRLVSLYQLILSSLSLSLTGPTRFVPVCSSAHPTPHSRFSSSKKRGGRGVTEECRSPMLFLLLRLQSSFKHLLLTRQQRTMY